MSRTRWPGVLVAGMALMISTLQGTASTGTGVLGATFGTATDLPITSHGYTAAGTVNFTLNHAPTPGATLMVVNNTGLSFISGTFSNLAQGQVVALSYGGVNYNFVANYYGGTGNDLVLQWAAALPVAWGDNNPFGQLGNNSGTNSSVPVAVDTSGVLAGKAIFAMAAGVEHSLALCSDGTLAAWGGNGNGQLGNGSTTSSSVPVAVDTSGVLSGKTVIAVAAGNSHSLVLCSDGTLAAWGNNSAGQLGNGTTTTSNPFGSYSPVAVDTSGVLSGKTVIAVAAGGSHSLALCSDGTLAAWGSNGQGQLGNGSTTSSSVPAAVHTAGMLAGRTVIALAGGQYHSLALCSDGTVAAWGDNGNGQLGNSSGSIITMPVAVDTSGVLSGKMVIAVAAGGSHSLALCSDGTLASWGYNNWGQLGNTISVWSPVPVAVNTAGVLAGKVVVAVAAGTLHSLALCSDGTLAAWGYNGSGQLGDNSPLGSSTYSPVLVNANSLPVGSRFVLGTSGQSASHSLGLLAVSAPYLSVQQPSGTSLTSGTTSRDFGAAVIGKEVARVFTVKNTGSAALSGFSFTFDGANAGDFSVPIPPAASVAVGNSTTFVVTFLPGAAGLRSTILHMASNAIGQSPFNIPLTGTGASDPSINMQPFSIMVGVGQTAALTVGASGGALNYQWLKNNVAVSSTPNDGHRQTAATLADAALYQVKITNIVGSVTSAAASVGVVNIAPATVTVVNGNSITLWASAAGPGITYQWLENGTAMANGTDPANSQGTISGVTTSKLTITKAAAADSGTYSCLVTMPDPQNPGSPLSLASGVITLDVTVPPVLDAFSPNPWIVSGTVTDVVTAENYPTAFGVKGQPEGVTLNARGQFQGKPVVSISTTTTYHLTITASNSAGSSAPLMVDVTVQPLQPNAIGIFNGLVDRDATLSGSYDGSNNGYGGTLNIASLSTGIFTGKLTLGGMSYSIPAQPLDAVEAGNSTATVVIPRKLPQYNLTLSFSIDPGSGELIGSVTDGAIATPVPIDAWRNPWNSPSNPAPLAATYTAALILDPSLTGTGTTTSNVVYPQGTGYGTLTVTTAGAATWSGKMADGAVTTASTTMGPNGNVPLHFMLYSNTGSAHGWITASADSTSPPANNGLRLLDGSVDWFKSKATTTTDRTYNAGIPLNTLTVSGGEYVKPTTTVLGLTDNGTGTSDAKLAFSEGGLTGPAPIVPATMATAPNVSFRITSTNVLVMPTAANNPTGLTLTLNAATGAFSGTFVLKNDQDPTKTTTSLLSRAVNYYGLLVPRVSVNQGLGFFLLPELPANATANTPKTTLSTSPILSGQVLLESGP